MADETGAEKPVGKGLGGFADAGDERSQEERIASLEARVAALETPAEPVV